MADSCGKTKYAMGATMLGVLLSGCVMTSREPRPQSPPDYPATVGQSPAIQDVSFYQRNYRFLPSPSGSTTEVAFWITRDDSGDFHVPWVHGGDWFVAGSERVVIDPVGKTLALDFGASNGAFQCPSFERNDDRQALGYTPCSSHFSRFPERPAPYVQPVAPAPRPLSLFDKLMGHEPRPFVPPPAPPKPKAMVGISANEVALAALQLNLFTAAERELEGGAVDSRLAARDQYSQLLQTGQAYEANLRSRQERIIREYLSATKRQPRDFSYQVIDRSGYYSYDTPWTGDVRLLPQAVERRNYRYTGIADELKRHDASDATKAVANLLGERMKQQYQRDYDALVRDLAQVTQAYRVDCRYPDVLGAYKVAVRCPSTVARTESGMQIPVVVEVIAKRFGLVIPGYASHNSDVSVVVDGEFLFIRNSLDVPLEVVSLTLMADGVTQLVELKGLAEIEPLGQKQIKLADVMNPAMKAALEVPFVSRREAVSKVLAFGASLRYVPRMPDRKTEVRELAQKTEYRLHELLSAR